jgi:hypothetical protein
MMSLDTAGSAELLVRAQRVLGLTQEKLGDLMGGRSRRSIIRWQQRGHSLLADDCATLARACYPHDRALAEAFAVRGGHTLASLGLERPLPPLLPAPAVHAQDSARHKADSVVCAAAETMQCAPQAIRPALVAALERVIAQGMTAEEALRGMVLEKTPDKPGKAPRATKE